MIQEEEHSNGKPRAKLSFPFKGTREEKILFALQRVEPGSAADVAGKLSELEEVENVAGLEEEVEKTLSSLCTDDVVECSLNGR